MHLPCSPLKSFYKKVVSISISNLKRHEVWVGGWQADFVNLNHDLNAAIEFIRRKINQMDSVTINLSTIHFL